MSGGEGSRHTSVLVEASEAMRNVVDLIDSVAESDCSVLIEGESGTGKELVARRLHAKSPRRRKPFIPVNCAGISETLFESQFFGHVRGAFTGAEQSMQGLVRSAEGGTLFMDEVGEISLNLQSKFLRVLQDGEVMPVGTSSPVQVDTRFVAATNRNLRDDVREKRFREDLYYRLNVIRIHLPPLRKRREDIAVLIDDFLARYSERYNRPAVKVDAGVRRQLVEYAWPGNARELASWVERLYATRLDPHVLVSSLLIEAEDDALHEEKHTRPMSLDDAERSAITAALAATENNRSTAASILGINRGTLLRKISQYQIS